MEQMRNRAIVKPFSLQSVLLNIQSPSAMVIRLTGISSAATKMSATAKFTINMLVLVRMPLCRRIVKMTIMFPPIANTIMQTKIKAMGTTIALP